MLLELLQHALGIEPRVGIIEPGDETEGDDVVFTAINPCAAILFRRKRPSHGVDHLAASYAAWLHLPKFFDADAVGLRVAFFVKPESRDQLLGKGAASALGQDDNAGL